MGTAHRQSWTRPPSRRARRAHARLERLRQPRGFCEVGRRSMRGPRRLRKNGAKYDLGQCIVDRSNSAAGHCRREGARGYAEFHPGEASTCFGSIESCDPVALSAETRSTDRSPARTCSPGSARRRSVQRRRPCRATASSDVLARARRQSGRVRRGRADGRRDVRLQLDTNGSRRATCRSSATRASSCGSERDADDPGLEFKGSASRRRQRRCLRGRER